MKVNFNLPEAADTVTITLNGCGKTKSYVFDRRELEMFKEDRKRIAYMNAAIGPDWPKSLIKKFKSEPKVGEVVAVADPVDVTSEDDGK